MMMKKKEKEKEKKKKYYDILPVHPSNITKTYLKWNVQLFFIFLTYLSLTTTTTTVASASFISTPKTSFYSRSLLGKSHHDSSIKRLYPWSLSQKRTLTSQFSATATTADNDSNKNNHNQQNKITGVIPRQSLKQFQSSFQNEQTLNTPILLTNLLPPKEVERIAWTLLRCLSEEHVVLQRRLTLQKINHFVKNTSSSSSEKNKDEFKLIVKTEFYNDTLEDAIEEIMDSSHEDAAFAFCEGLLESSKHPHVVKIAEELSFIRNLPFVSSSSSSSSLQEEEKEKGDSTYKENWFDYFPSSAHVSDAVVLAGEGATSTLHRDPFEWTGTSFCLEGSKVWRFILPTKSKKGSFEKTESEAKEEEEDFEDGVKDVDEALNCYRLNSIAWGDDNNETTNPQNAKEATAAATTTTLSAGWQSNMSLFQHRSMEVPSARKLDELLGDGVDPYNVEAHRRTLELIGVNSTLLEPSQEAIDALESLQKIRRRQQQHQSSKAEETDKHEDNDDNNDDDGDGDVQFVTAIQQAGDLLLIPAHCWHQTYALEPSISVASQRCTAEIDGRNVIQHVLKTVHDQQLQQQKQEGEQGKKGEKYQANDHIVNVPEILQRRSYKEGEGEEVVSALFDYLSSTPQKSV